MALVLLGMAAFGAVEQLVLCPSPRRGKKAGQPGGPGRQNRNMVGVIADRSIQ